MTIKPVNIFAQFCVQDVGIALGWGKNFSAAGQAVRDAIASISLPFRRSA